MLVTRRQASSGILAAAAAVAAATSGVAAQGATPMQLPPPRAQGGKPLIEALKLRRSTREYADRTLPPQVLSDLLWAAFGINRPSGDRTAPYWRHIMVIDVYAAMADGLWFYEPKDHSLQRRSSVDIRAATGLQDFVATAPLNLVYVAHGERMHTMCPPRSAVSMLASMQVLSGRTSICFAPLRASRPFFAEPSIPENLREQWSSTPSNS
jgi:hypothetical protein